MRARTWQPLLEADLAERAWQAVREIADDLAALDHGPRDVEQALFWAYAAGAFDDARSQQRLERAADRLAIRLESGFAGLALYGGLLGAGWVAQHLGGEEDNDELFARPSARSPSRRWRPSEVPLRSTAGSAAAAATAARSIFGRETARGT